jgi:hypothetical protein
VVGLWVGLSLGLTLVAIVLVWVWRQHLHRLADVLASPGPRHTGEGAMSVGDRLFAAVLLMRHLHVHVFLSVFQLIPTAPFHLHDLGGARWPRGSSWASSRSPRRGPVRLRARLPTDSAAVAPL